MSEVKSRLGIALNKNSLDTFLSVGFLNGFLPCGLVYVAVFGALATNGNFLYGALYMILFGLGTIPMMILALSLNHVFSLNVRKKIRRAIPIVLFIMGVLFVLRGMGLGIPYVSPIEPLHFSSQFECHN